MRLASGKDRNIITDKLPNFASVIWKRVTGMVGERLVALGKAKLMADQKVDMGSLAAKS